MSFVVGPGDDGRRFDVVVAATLGVSRSRAAALLDADRVLVDGRPAARGHRARHGQRVEVRADESQATPVAAPPLPPVRLLDPAVLVVAKPPGLVVHAGAGHDGDTLVDAVLAAGIELAPAAGAHRPGVVHRLDRDTSGLLVMARTDAAHATLVDALRRREVTRHYLTLVAGVPRDPRGRIEAPVGRDPHRRTRFAVVAGAKSAVTRYRVLETAEVPGHDAPVALLACTLETGRTHQIRVHLHALGHPVLGDPAYGPRPQLAAALGLERPFLHAAELAFDHPTTGARVTLYEPLPEDLRAALAGLGLRPDGLEDRLSDQRSG